MLSPCRAVVSSYWSANTGITMWRGPLENVTYKFVFASPAIPHVLFVLALEMGRKWPYSCCFVGCCFQDLFNITRSILVQFPSNFFCMRFVSIHVVHLSHEKSKVGDRSRGWPKSPFSIATTPRCREGRYSIPWIAPLYPWSLPYNSEC